MNKGRYCGLCCFRIDELLVHSYEMGVYLVEADYDGRRGYVVGQDNHPQRFQSVDQVKQLLHACKVQQAWLVQQSAYDEMCGSAEQTSNVIKTPLLM